MGEANFKIRFMQVEEAARVGELIHQLQLYQKMNEVPRLPSAEDVIREVTHLDEDSGEMLPNRYGTHVIVAIDKSKQLNDSKNFDYVIGYQIYSQSFTILQGRCFWMNSFFISDGYRHIGLGTKFMEFLRLHALATKNNILHVPYMNNNLIGQKFYSRYGSEKVNEEFNIMVMKRTKL